MGILIDLVIVILIALSTFLGYKKGLISLGIKLVAFIVAIIITFILYRPIANIVINSTTIDEKLQETIQTKVEKFLLEENENKAEAEYKTDIIKSAESGMLTETSRTLAINIIYGVTAIILYAIARVCLILINSLANTIAELPIIKQFNELGGAIVGALRGILIICVILMVTNLIIEANPKSSLNEIMDSTYVAKTMSKYNVLNLFLNKVEI